MEKLRFFDFMRAGHVKRWHIVNTTRDQTIAEHQYLVTIIAMELYQKLSLREDAMSGPGMLGLICGAMFSDAPEVRYGDYPTPAKNVVRDMAGTTSEWTDIFQAMDKALMPTLPYIGGELEPWQRDIIGMADIIEAAHWITENKAGIHADMVAKGACRRMAQRVVELTNRTGVDWFTPVNEILQELGMSYISKSLLMTPP